MIPGYWQHETSGVLRPAVEAYLHGEPMTPEQIAAMRTYLRQWISAPTWRGADVDKLRARVDGLFAVDSIDRWLRDAEAMGIDPL
jgi:hypothetical protein